MGKLIKSAGFVFAIVLVIGVASAALVTYLSNTLTATATISSPLQMTGGTLLNTNVLGGDQIQYSVTTINKANATIWSFPVTEVTAPVGTTFSGNEFTSIVLQDPSGTYDVTGMIKYVKADGTLDAWANVGTASLNKVKIVFDNGVTFDPTKGYVRAVGFNEENNITITVAAAIAPGDYVIQSCQLYSLLGDC